jgi:hypothetical protein
MNVLSIGAAHGAIAAVLQRAVLDAAPADGRGETATP